MLPNHVSFHLYPASESSQCGFLPDLELFHYLLPVRPEHGQFSDGFPFPVPLPPMIIIEHGFPLCDFFHFRVPFFRGPAVFSIEIIPHRAMLKRFGDIGKLRSGCLFRAKSMASNLPNLFPSCPLLKLRSRSLALMEFLPRRSRSTRPLPCGLIVMYPGMTLMFPKTKRPGELQFHIPENFRG